MDKICADIEKKSLSLRRNTSKFKLLSALGEQYYSVILIRDIKMEEHVSVLRTDNLVKRYGPRTVADHVSIDVRQGEIVGLLGPNGAGKTTTFYMTTGLVTPNEGRIFLDDQEITKLPVYRRAKLGIGYLAQEASVYRKMSVEDNLRATLEMTPMTPLGDRLSGGERRRCEIARCLAISPKFIMLDEPFAGVDPIAVEDIQYIVYKLKDKNIGILITDHNAPETLSIVDRAYLLFEGKILFQGTSEELAANPIVREKYLGRLAANPIVREKYLGRNFVFIRKKFDQPSTTEEVAMRAAAAEKDKQ